MQVAEHALERNPCIVSYQLSIPARCFDDDVSRNIMLYIQYVEDSSVFDLFFPHNKAFSANQDFSRPSKLGRLMTHLVQT